jgi:uncharacterized protein YjbI with pentapeptide repeats
VPTSYELRTRWYDPTWGSLRLQTKRWLLGEGSQPSGLLTIDGRVDLRGYPLSATSTTVESGDDGGVLWDSLDLRGAQLDQLRFIGARLQDCLFDGASCQGWRLWGIHAEGCSFRRAKLGGSSLGTGDEAGRRTVWQDADFSRADLKGVVFRNAVIRGCLFENAGGLEVDDCEVVDVRFQGALRRILMSARGRWWPAVPRDLAVDFRDSVWDDVTLESYRVRKELLPDQEGLVLVHDFRSVLGRAVGMVDANLPAAIGEQARGVLRGWATSEGPAGVDLCFDVPHDQPELWTAVTRAISEATDTI